MGEIVKAQNYNDKINISLLPSGFYIIQIIAEENNEHTSIFIKN